MAKEQSIEKQIRSLITNECANHFSKCDNTNNYCCLEWTKDLSCIYFQQEPEYQRCSYFEESVLLLSEELKVIYNTQIDSDRKLTDFERKEIRENLFNKNKKICTICNKEFSPKSNRQKYCDICSNKIKKDKERNRYIEKKINKKTIL